MVDENIFVIGDASIAGAMPKSGFSANSQAKVAAMNVAVILPVRKSFRRNTPIPAGASLTTDDGVKVGAQYEPQDGKIASTASPSSARPVRKLQCAKPPMKSLIGWYAGITKDMFG